jgi:hypothetical protein
MEQASSFGGHLRSYNTNTDPGANIQDSNSTGSIQIFFLIFKHCTDLSLLTEVYFHYTPMFDYMI